MYYSGRINLFMAELCKRAQFYLLKLLSQVMVFLQEQLKDGNLV